ncbi:MAG: MoaD/ThiS family protein [Methanoregula sp.]|nr:MoaD/ThiS family protein [Methanoregula sp.]
MNEHYGTGTAMLVTIRSFASLRSVMPEESCRELDEESTMEDLLQDLVKQYPGLVPELYTGAGLLNPRVNILVNGRNIQHLAGLGTVIGAGSLIAIFPPAAGG